MYFNNNREMHIIFKDARRFSSQFFRKAESYSFAVAVLFEIAIPAYQTHLRATPLVAQLWVYWVRLSGGIRTVSHLHVRARLTHAEHPLVENNVLLVLAEFHVIEVALVGGYVD